MMRELPLLTQVITKRAPRDPNSGLCFHRAAALLLDLPHGQLAIGTLPGATAEQRRIDARFSPVPFLHAWVEVGGVLLAPTLIEMHGGALAKIDRAEYYRENQVRDVYRMPRAQLKRIARAQGWLRDPFGERPGAPGVGKVLIEALGIPFILIDGERVPGPATAMNFERGKL